MPYYSRPAQHLLALVFWVALLIPVFPAKLQAPPRGSAVRPTDSWSAHKGIVGDPVSQRLVEGSEITSAFDGPETHWYQLTLLANQYARLDFAQTGLRLRATCIGPGNEQVASVAVSDHGRTELSVLAALSGDYRLEVKSQAGSVPGSQYRLRLENIRSATRGDRLAAAAQRDFWDAEQLCDEWKSSSIERANVKLESAARNWGVSGHTESQAKALRVRAANRSALSQYQAAIEDYRRALRLDRSLRNASGEIEDLTGLGSNYVLLGRQREAEQILEEALRQSELASDRWGQAHALSGLGEVYHYRSEERKALLLYEKAETIARSLGNRECLARTLYLAGNSWGDLAESERSLRVFEEALHIWESLGNRRWRGETLHVLGLVSASLGERQRALELERQALEIFRDIGNRTSEASALDGVGDYYLGIGDYPKALRYYLQALRLFRKSGAVTGEQSSADLAGEALYLMGDHRRALGYYRMSYSLSRSLGDPRLKGYALHNIGFVYQAMGERTKAYGAYARSLALRRQASDRRGEALTLNGLGRLLERDGKLELALQYHRQALSISQSIADHSEEAETLCYLAAVDRKRGNLKEAEEQAARALNIIETLGEKVYSNEFRASYFATVHARYEFYISLLMELHAKYPSAKYDAAALEASERARARSLLAILTESGTNIREGVDPVLIERERAVQQQLNAKAERQIRLLSEKARYEELAAIKSDIERLTTAYRELDASIRAQSPAYAALTSPISVSLSQIQRDILDGETVLLEFSLGDNKSYLWMVDQSSIRSFELPKRAEIAAMVARAREVYASSPDQAPARKRTRRTDKKRAANWKAAFDLSRVLLGNVAPQLESKRLLVVSEGPLQYLPFAALPEPNGQSGDSAATSTEVDSLPANYKPLVIDHEIVRTPSVTALAILRQQTSGRPLAPKTVAVLADPVFDFDDERVNAPSKVTAKRRERLPSSSSSSESESIAGAFRRFGVQGKDDRLIPRLPFTRREAEMILSATSASDELGALDFQASRATALSGVLRQFRIVHFATHGLFDDEHPELSGIVLSLVNRRGEPENGFLRLNEIYGLRLSAELVVLSACQTGLGKEVRGEGLLGLTRGFMCAGARRVLASLWKVDDVATSELMQRFYKALLGQRRLSAGAALRSAQLEMWKQKRWQNPYYWAGFVLQGEFE